MQLILSFDVFPVVTTCSRELMWNINNFPKVHKKSETLTISQKSIKKKIFLQILKFVLNVLQWEYS